MRLGDAALGGETGGAKIIDAGTVGRWNGKRWWFVRLYCVRPAGCGSELSRGHR
jgi:hypothetical protein